LDRVADDIPPKPEHSAEGLRVSTEVTNRGLVADEEVQELALFLLSQEFKSPDSTDKSSTRPQLGRSYRNISHLLLTFFEAAKDSSI